MNMYMYRAEDKAIHDVEVLPNNNVISSLQTFNDNKLCKIKFCGYMIVYPPVQAIL